MPLTAESAARKDRTTANGSPELQHRHFAFIAATLSNMKPTKRNSTFELRTSEWRGACNSFADACAVSNPRFDRKRFLTACNV